MSAPGRGPGPATSVRAVEPFPGDFGARVTDLDLRAADARATAALEALLRRYLLLVLPGQHLAAEEQVLVARRFGPLHRNPFLPAPLPGRPEVVVMESDRPIATEWHADGTYERFPPRLTFLTMVICPRSGGDTVWADQRRALASLPARTRERLRGLSAVHSTPSGDRVAVHPLVRRDAETGTESLFANRHFTRQVVGLPPADSESLLERIFAAAEQPGIQYRHRWQAGDLVVCDNRATLHRVCADYDERRRVERLTVASAAAWG